MNAGRMCLKKPEGRRQALRRTELYQHENYADLDSAMAGRGPARAVPPKYRIPNTPPGYDPQYMGSESVIVKALLGPMAHGLAVAIELGADAIEKGVQELLPRPTQLDGWGNGTARQDNTHVSTRNTLSDD